MKSRYLALIGALAALIVVSLVPIRVAGQASTNTNGGPPKTPWGEPDFQGIWSDNTFTPLQRPAKYAGKESFTDAEIAALDKQRAAIPRRDLRAQAGSDADVAGAYNSFWMSVRPTGRRTSLIVDPPDGRIPLLTSEAQKRNAVRREFQAALLQATDACKNNTAACAGGKYGPPSPKRAEAPPYYNTDRLPNRVDGPEDRSLLERCLAMGAMLPDFSNDMSWGSRQIVQSPGVVSIFYDVGQGQGWSRIIPITTAPHLPQHFRRWAGDSRAHWEGNTLVVDVTNFTTKTDFGGSRETLHLIERWTRTGPTTLEYVVTIDDPTTWTTPWTATQEYDKQSDQANRFYREPRCHEGNFGMIGMLAGARAQEKAFAEGRGPDPATLGGGGGGGGGEENQDPLQR